MHPIIGQTLDGNPPNSEDKAWLAYCPPLEGCVTFVRTLLGHCSKMIHHHEDHTNRTIAATGRDVAVTRQQQRPAEDTTPGAMRTAMRSRETNPRRRCRAEEE
jgi:hypothetical protein